MYLTLWFNGILDFESHSIAYKYNLETIQLLGENIRSLHNCTYLVPQKLTHSIKTLIAKKN